MLIIAFKILIQSIVLSGISFFLILEFDNFNKNENSQNIKDYIEKKLEISKNSLTSEIDNNDVINSVFAAKSLNLTVDVTQKELDSCFKDKIEKNCKTLIKTVLKDNID